MASVFGAGALFIVLLILTAFCNYTLRFLLATVTVYPRVADFNDT